MIKSEQLWMKFVRDGFICDDMKGAKRAFLAALDIANGVKSYDDDAVRRKIDEEINYIWCDEYTNHVLSKIGIGQELKQKMLQDFSVQEFSKGRTHASLSQAREHFLNWVKLVKDKYGVDDNNTIWQWREDIVARIERLAKPSRS